MFISIVVPVHNAEPFIDDCIGSLLSQDFEDYEIILVENGSSDESYNRCVELNKLSDKIRLFKSDKIGVSEARNLGISKAKGSYIWFVDADDFVEKNVLEVFAKNICFIDINNAPDIIIFNYNIVDGFNITEDYKQQKTGISFILDKKTAVNGLFDVKKWSGFVWNKIYKRDCINHMFNQDIHMAEDLVFNTWVFLDSEKFLFIDDSFYNYRKHESSISAKFDLRKLSSFQAYDEISHLLAEKPDYIFAQIILGCAKVDFSRQILKHYYIYDKKEYKRVRKHYTRIILDNVKYYKNLKSKIGAYLTVFVPRLLKCI